MPYLYDAVRMTHVLAGVLALVLFWVPALTRKGGRVHRRAGRTYVWAMGVVVATAVPLSIAFVIRGDWVVGTFLGYLAVITFSALWGGRRALDYKTDAATFRTPFHAAVGVANFVAAVAILVLAWVAADGFVRVLFTIFSVIGFSAAWETRQFFRRPPDDRRWWWYQHMGGMIGSGIAAHTAFGVFGMSRLFPELQFGTWGFLPWVAPSVIGTIATVALTRHYRRRFAMSVR